MYYQDGMAVYSDLYCTALETPYFTHWSTIPRTLYIIVSLYYVRNLYELQWS